MVISYTITFLITYIVGSLLVKYKPISHIPDKEDVNISITATCGGIALLIGFLFYVLFFFTQPNNISLWLYYIFNNCYYFNGCIR